MWQLVSKKTGKVSHIDDDTYYQLRDNKQLKRYVVTEIEERKIVTPKELLKVEMEDYKPKKKKND
jgi:CRISPR/Cas system CSM-associated protein Csm4 (group 5 of RAMP superfamily)